MAKSKKDGGSKRSKKEEAKEEAKKDSKKKKKKACTSSSSSSDPPEDDPEELKEAIACASTFGLKPKNLTLTKHVVKVADLRVGQLATVVCKVHPCLTPQSIFAMGGELVEVKKKISGQMKGADGHEQLRARMECMQALNMAEKRWRDRLLLVLQQVADMDELSVISQHSSLISMRRSIKIEIESATTGAEAASWLCKLKQTLMQGKQDAAKEISKEMAKEHEQDLPKEPMPKKPSSKRREPSSESSPPCLDVRFRAKAPKKESTIDASSSRGVGVNDTVPMTAELEEFFCDELARYFANGNDRALFLKIAVAEGMDTVEAVLLNIEDGWRCTSTTCGAHAKEMLQCMTWSGRRAACKLVGWLASKMEMYKKKAGLNDGRGGSDSETLELGQFPKLKHNKESKNTSDNAMPKTPPSEKDFPNGAAEAKRNTDINTENPDMNKEVTAEGVPGNTTPGQLSQNDSPDPAASPRDGHDGDEQLSDGGNESGDLKMSPEWLCKVLNPVQN